MDIFSIDVTHNELNFIRQALDTVQISGKDAKFLANLQVKVEQELINIQQMKQQEEQKKFYLENGVEIDKSGYAEKYKVPEKFKDQKEKIMEAFEIRYEKRIVFV